MKQNVGSLDRIIRLVIAAVLALLYYLNILSGIWGNVLLVIGALLLVTAIFGFCPLYSLLRINTCAVPQKGNTSN